MRQIALIYMDFGLARGPYVEDPCVLLREPDVRSSFG